MPQPRPAQSCSALDVGDGRENHDGKAVKRRAPFLPTIFVWLARRSWRSRHNPRGFDLKRARRRGFRSSRGRFPADTKSGLALGLLFSSCLPSGRQLAQHRGAPHQSPSSLGRFRLKPPGPVPWGAGGMEMPFSPEEAEPREIQSGHSSAR